MREWREGGGVGNRKKRKKEISRCRMFRTVKERYCRYELLLLQAWSTQHKGDSGCCGCQRSADWERTRTWERRDEIHVRRVKRQGGWRSWNEQWMVWEKEQMSNYVYNCILNFSWYLSALIIVSIWLFIRRHFYMRYVFETEKEREKRLKINTLSILQRIQSYILSWIKTREKQQKVRDR